MGAKPYITSNQSLTKDAATTDQLHTLLDVLGALHMVAANPPPDMVGNSQGQPMGGEAKIAAEISLVNACSRIDAILGDSNRWTVEAQDQLIASALALQNQHLQLARAQTKAAEEHNTPHARAKPSIFRLASGGWAAIAGGSVEHAIVATGSTPEEALVAFDLIFTGKLPARTVEWLTDREKAVANGTSKAEDSKVNYEQYAKSVDGTGSAATQNVAGRGSDVSHDRENTQKKPKVRRGKNGKRGNRPGSKS